MKLISYHNKPLSKIKSWKQQGREKGPYSDHHYNSISSFGVDITPHIVPLRDAGFVKYDFGNIIYKHIIDTQSLNESYFGEIKIASSSSQYDFYNSDPERYDAMDMKDYVKLLNKYLIKNDMASLSLRKLTKSKLVKNELRKTFDRIEESITGTGDYVSFINKNQYASIIPHVYAYIKKPIPVSKIIEIDLVNSSHRTIVNPQTYSEWRK